MRHNQLLATAITIFGVAQFMPAVWPDMGAWNNPDARAMPGFLVTLFAWPYWISNAALMLSPLLVSSFRRLKRARRALMLLLTFYLLTPISALAFCDSILGLAIGFYFWVASYCLAALGTSLAIPQQKESEQGADGDAEESV